MDLALAMSVLVALLIATFVIRRAGHRRAERARVEPMQPRSLEPRRLSPDALRARLRAYCDDDVGLRCEEAHSNLFITWKLPPEKGAIFVDHPVTHTWSVELKLSNDFTVFARYGDAAVHWTHLERDDPEMPALHRVFDWRWNAFPQFGGPEPVGEETVLRPDDKPYTSEGLVLPLQRLVLECGWAWQPTLLIDSIGVESTPPTTERQASRAPKTR